MLFIGATELQAINDLVEFAKRNPITPADLAFATQARGDDLLKWKTKLLRYNIHLPVGFLITYTQEQQEPGLCHHISVSVDSGIPTPSTMMILGNAFGFGDLLIERKVLRAWSETYPNGRIALNILALA